MKAAAEQLGMDASSVSRKINSLEARLGVKLLQRSTRRSSPTEAGYRYYEGLRRLLDEQSALEASVSDCSNTPTGLLRVAAPVDFGARFVSPVLQEMQFEFPELKVELLLGSSFEDISGQGLDIAIRIGKLPDSSLICRRLGEVQRVLVASSDYLKRKGTPRCTSDLKDHDFVFYTRKQSLTPIELIGPEGTEFIEVSGRYIANSVAALKEVVASGAGIHQGPLWAFKDDLQTGRLKIILPDFDLPAFPVHALYSYATYVPAKVRYFVDLMVQHTSGASSSLWDF